MRARVLARLPASQARAAPDGELPRTRDGRQGGLSRLWQGQAGHRPGLPRAARCRGSLAPAGPRRGWRCRARRVLARLRRLRRELRAEPSLLPVLPPPAPRAPRGSGGCRRPLRWEEEEAPEPRALGAKQRTVESGGRVPEGNTHVPQTGYLETRSFPRRSLSPVILRSLLSPLHLCSPLPAAALPCPCSARCPRWPRARLTVPFLLPSRRPPGRERG